jgi:hypothetical protein
MLSVARPWPSENEVQLLAERSGGQFIYASTAIKFIDDEDFRPTDRLKHVLDASGSDVFAELDQLYQQILSTAVNIGLLLRILGSILIARDRLSPLQLEFFLDLQEGDVHLVLRRIHSLLGISDRPTEPIEILHKSLPDFLFNPDRSGEYHISRKLCHYELALGCLRWVKRDMLQRTRHCDLERYDSLGLVPAPRIGKRAYAGRYWAAHCTEAEHQDRISVYLKTFDSFTWSGLSCNEYEPRASIEELRITIKWLKEVGKYSFYKNIFGDYNLTFQDLDIPESKDLVVHLCKMRNQMHLRSDKGHIIRGFFTTFVCLHLDDFIELARPPNEIRHEVQMAFQEFETKDPLGNPDLTGIWEYHEGPLGYTHSRLAIYCIELLLDYEVRHERSVVCLFKVGFLEKETYNVSQAISQTCSRKVCEEILGYACRILRRCSDVS